MSEFSARKKDTIKQSVISAEPDAKSKKLDETMEKLSAIKAEKGKAPDANFPSVSVKETKTANTKETKTANTDVQGSTLTRSLRVTSVVTNKPPEKKAETKSSESKPTASKPAEKKPVITQKVDMPAKTVVQKKAEAPKIEEKAPQSAPPMDIRAPKRSNARIEEMFEGDADNEPVLMLSPKNSVPMRRSSRFRFTTFFGVILTAGWLGLTGAYVQNNMGWEELISQQPHILGGFLAGILAPLAMLWMVLAYIQRGSDIHMYADALRGELQAMIFPSEERSGIIHKDIEALCAQAAELSTSSKAVLNSIHRARIGLRNEIRDFSGLSKKTEFHIDRLADSLAERSNKLMALTDEIEKRTTSLDAKTISGAAAWDEAAQSILGKASEIETTLHKGAEKILNAATEADNTTGAINNKLENSFNVLKSSVDSVKTITGSTVKAILDAGKTIEDNRDTLDNGAKLLAEKASEITGSLNGSVSAIQDSVDQLASKTDSIEDRLNNRVTSFSDLLKDMDGKIISIENMGTETANKLSEAMVASVSGADNIGASVRRAIESLGKATTDAATQVEDLMEQASDKITDIHDTGEETAKNMQSVLALMEKSREQMQDSSEMVDAQVKKLSQAVTLQSEEISQAQDSLNDRVAAIQIQMAKPLEAMGLAVDQAGAKHAEIEETLSKRIAELNNASDKALENAQTIRDGLRNQTQEISTLVGQIAGHSRSVHSLISNQKEDLSKDITETLDKIETVGQALQLQSEALSNISRSAEENIVQLKGSLSEQCGDITKDSTQVVESLTSLNNIVEQKVRALIDNSGKACSSVEEVTSALVSSANTVDPLYQRATNQINATRDRFEKMSSSFEEGTTSNLEKLKSMGILFDERLQTLTSSAEDASNILDQSAENLSTRVEDIDGATKSASEKLQEMERLFKNQASDIHLTTDQALIRIENTQKALNDQFQDLSASVAESVAQIEDVGEQFVKQTGQIKDVSGDAVEQLGTVGDRANEQTQALKRIAQVTAEQMEHVVKKVQTEAKELLEMSSQTLMEMKKTGDGFALRAKEVEEQMRLSLETTQQYGASLDEQADKVAESSHKTVDQISEAVAKLSGKMLDVNKAANDVSGQIELSRDKLTSETEHLADVSIKAARVVEEAASSYVRQSNSLFKATQDAADHAEKIRQNDWRVQRDSFMGSAKFVLESLHSLSVDLTRMMEGGVQEKIWKAYQKGDLAVFTERLMEKKDQIPLEKMREKYASDNEFRTYVGRFIRQFEEMYEQAHANDQGALLSATFASSAIGGLYGVLCDIAGRPNLIKKLSKIAA